MGTKSIGAFIASLRKEKQITQQELAEVLNVSNKTVSRWETGEGTPDISLIPVIADYFNLTCDELLRGELQSEGKKEASPSNEKVGSRTLWYCTVCLVIGTLLFFLCSAAFKQYIVSLCCYGIGFVFGVCFFVRCYLYQEQKEEDKKKLLFYYLWMCILSISIMLPYILMESYYIRLRSYMFYWVAMLPILYFVSTILRQFVYETSKETMAVLVKLDAVQYGFGVVLLLFFGVVKDCSVWATVMGLFFYGIFNYIWVAILLSRYHVKGIALIVPAIRNVFLVVGGILVYNYVLIEKPILLLPTKYILGAVIGYLLLIGGFVLMNLFITHNSR